MTLDRCLAAGVPTDVGLVTKPSLAQVMVVRAPKRRRPRWATGNRRLPVDAATSRTAAQIAADLPRRAWQVRSAGAGAHGPRRYAWAWIELHPRTAAAAQRRPGDHEPPPRGSWSPTSTALPWRR
jgi:hypothetical protein